MQQNALFSYLSPEQRVPKDHPLRMIRRLTDRALERLSERLERMYCWTGRPSIPPEKLLRALLLQILYTLRSERLLREQLDYKWTSTKRSGPTKHTSRRRTPRPGWRGRATEKRPS